MKKQIFSLIACVSMDLVACNNDSDTTASGDSVSTTTTSTSTPTTDYAAIADSFQRNSDAGKYMDGLAGKPIKISVDRASGRKMNAETNEQIDRYIYADNS